jgi:hypothetical protein
MKEGAIRKPRGICVDDRWTRSRPESRLKLMRALTMELLGWIYYRIAGYI